MKLKFLLIEILFLLILLEGHCQQWVKIYGGSINTQSFKIQEHYDKGYIFTGEKFEGWSYYGWLMKTDINGEVLWSKEYGITQKMNQFVSSRMTNDSGGGILCGSTNNLSINCTDPLIVKVNACGEKEWCKIYNAPGCNCWASDVEVIAQYGYLALITQWNPDEEERISLFRLDSVGEVIWAQSYATDTAFWSEVPHSLLKTTDSSFVITGETYYPDSTYPNKKIIKIILIKVDINGNAIFEVPWGTNNGVYSKGYQSIEDSQHNIYTAGEHPRTTSPGGDSPCLFKTNPSGDPVNLFDLMNTTYKGTSSTIDWFADSTMALGSVWGYYGIPDSTGVIKTDRSGTLIKAKPLLTNYGYTFNDADITFNNSLIITGGFYTLTNWQAYAFKLTSNLNYDSIYTTPFTYDSLCSHPIVSDTLPLDDCEVVIVGIDDPLKYPEKTKLHVFPNPAQNIVTIEMPQYLNRQNKGNGITAITTYHQWKTTTLEIYDLFGKLMLSREVPSQIKFLNIDISLWSAGMYVARLIYLNDVVSAVKFIKQ